MYKSTEKATTAPKPSLENWKTAQAELIPLVKEALNRVGFKGFTDKSIRPKTLREYPHGKYLYVKSFEFEKPMIAVFYDRTWQERISVEDGLPTSDLKVYLLKPCKNYAEVYKSEELDEYGPYLVPIEDLELIYPKDSSATPGLFDMTTSADLSDEEDKDENLSAMTIRDYLAIHQCMPVSTKPWLNDTIKKINAIRNKD